MAKRVILDTNVLVAGLRSRNGASFKLLTLLGLGHLETSISVPLVFEYEDVLRRASLAIPQSSVNAVLDYLCRVSHQQQIHYLWRPFLKDPKDDMVLELAVASQSAAIITFNVRDFASIGKFGLSAQTPGEFLGELGVNL